MRRLPEEQKWCLEAVLGVHGFPWSYAGKGHRRRPLYTGAMAKAAGRADAESIAAATPKPNLGEAYSGVPCLGGA